MRSAILAAASAVALFATPALASDFSSEELTVQGPGGPLKGTLVRPAARSDAPVIVFIPGSGPTNRDGDNPVGVAGRPYARFLEALAADGIASIRVDKRGQFGSAGASFGEAGPTVSAYAEDVKAWIGAAMERTGARCVWLAGHSEGALVAEVVAQDDNRLCGLILLSGGGRRLSDVIREQVNNNPANPQDIRDQTEAALKALEAGRPVDVGTLNPALQPLFNPGAQPLLISLFSYDPAGLLKTYKGPVLVVQGTTDLQIRMADAVRLSEARPGVELVVIEGMNHVMRTAPEDMAGNFATYAQADAPVAPGLAEAVAAFIKKPR